MGDGDRDGSRTGFGDGRQADDVGDKGAGSFRGAVRGCIVVSKVDMRGGG